MLDASHCNEVKRVLTDLSLSEPCYRADKVPPCLQNYLEFYGFFETLKAAEVEHCWGYRSGTEAGRIATHYWRVPEARGTVLLVHGLFDHVGLFLPLVRHFVDHRYCVIAIDLPGHGLSDGEATAIASFDVYRDVLLETLAFFAEETSDRPIYGVGQSTGAAALMSMQFHLSRQGLPLIFERLVFLGPLIQPRQWAVSRWIYRLFGRRIQSVARDLRVANTNDTEFHNFLKSYDPLQAQRLSTRWVGALNEWINEFARQPVVPTPLLVVQGTADRVVDWQTNIPQIKAHFSCVQVNMIEGAKHHLANEADPWRKAVYTSISQFFRQRTVCTLPD